MAVEDWIISVPDGLVHYVIIFRNNPLTGLVQVWDEVADLWTTYDGADVVDYAIIAPETAGLSGVYVATLPTAAVDEGAPRILAWFNSVDGTPSPGDVLVERYTAAFDGVANAMIPYARNFNPGTLQSTMENAIVDQRPFIADDVWEEPLAGHSGTVGSPAERLTRVPNAAAGANGGLPTVNASNQVAGIAGVTFPAGFNALTTANIQSGLATQAALNGVAVTTTDILSDVSTLNVTADSIQLDTAQIGLAGAGLTALASSAAVSEIDAKLGAPSVTVAADIATRATNAGAAAAVAATTPPEPFFENAPSGGGGGAPIAPITVAKERTWFPDAFDPSRAANVITVQAPFAKTLAVELPLNPDADLDELDEVTCTPPSGTVTPTNFQTTADGRTAHFDVGTLTAVGDYHFVVTGTTKDDQTISMRCKLVVK